MFRLFFGRIRDFIICFRDLLTFTNLPRLVKERTFIKSVMVLHNGSKNFINSQLTSINPPTIIIIWHNCSICTGFHYLKMRIHNRLCFTYVFHKFPHDICCDFSCICFFGVSDFGTQKFSGIKMSLGAHRSYEREHSILRADLNVKVCQSIIKRCLV